MLTPAGSAPWFQAREKSCQMPGIAWLHPSFEVLHHLLSPQEGDVLQKDHAIDVHPESSGQCISFELPTPGPE